MMHVKTLLKIIRIIVMVAQVLVLIYRLCGFSSDILKSHELLKICNLIYYTRLKEAEKISTSWRKHFAETVFFSTCVLDTIVFIYVVLHNKNKSLFPDTSDFKTIKPFVFNTQTKCTYILKYVY